MIKNDLYKSCWSILDFLGFGWEILIPILGKPGPKNNPFLGPRNPIIGNRMESFNPNTAKKLAQK